MIDTVCAHCKRDALGFALYGSARLCHTGSSPAESDPMDCYRLVIIAKHPADGTCQCTVKKPLWRRVAMRVVGRDPGWKR